MAQSNTARKQLRLGWLSTGRGPGSQALLRSAQSAISEGSLNASIEFVLCTREPGEAQGSDEFLALAQNLDLKTVPLSFRRYREQHSNTPHWRDQYNDRLTWSIERHNVDALVFAGLLLVVGENVVNRFKALNLHPAAPNGPVGTWKEVIASLLAQNADRTGISIQLATEQLDKGPVVAFSQFPIRGPGYAGLMTKSLEMWRNHFPNVESNEIPAGLGAEVQLAQLYRNMYVHSHFATSSKLEEDPLFARIRGEGLKREALTLVEALRQLAGGSVQIKDGVVRDANGDPLETGLDITQQIEDLLAEQADA